MSPIPSCNPRNTSRAWVIVLVSALFFFYEFMQMNIFNAINTSLSQEFNLTAAQVSNLSAYYFYTDVLFLVPAGILLDYFSTKKLIVIAMLICSVAMLILSQAHSFWLAATMRALSGVGAAFCLLAPVRIASRWLSAKQLAFAVGIIVTFGMVGGMAAQTPIVLINQAVGWRHTLIVDGAFGVLVTIFIATIVKDTPNPSDEIAVARVSELSLFKRVTLSISNIQNWLAGLYTCLLNLPILLLGALWGLTYLHQIKSFSNTQASLINMMLFVGMIVGSPLVGKWSDAMGARKPLMVWGAITSVVIMTLIMLLNHVSLPLSMLLFFLAGFFSSFQILSYPLVSENNPQSISSTAMGITSMIIMSGGAWGQPLFGWLLDLHWDGTKLNGIPIFSQHDFIYAIALFPIANIIALILVLFIKEKKQEW